MTRKTDGRGCNGQTGGGHIVLVYEGEEYRLPETPDVNRLVYRLATRTKETKS